MNGPYLGLYFWDWESSLREALPNFRLVFRKCPRTVGQWGKGMGRAEKEIM